MFTALTPEKIRIYLIELKSSSLSTEKVDQKVKDINKFLDWAVEKGHISTIQFNQLKAETANLIFSKNQKDYPEGTKLPINKNLSISQVHEKNSFIFTNKLQFFSYSILAVVTLGVLYLVYSHTTSTVKPNMKAGIEKTRVLSFKAKITDSLGNPIIDKTDVLFKLYTSKTSINPLYVGRCTGMNAVSPDIKGYITIKLGQDCGMKPLADSLFLNNPELFLGLTTGSDPEMQPRKQIANVGFSSNSNTLQGLPTGKSISSIPYINEDGDLLIESDNASISSVSKSSNFTVYSANILNLKSQNDLNITTTKDGSIKFQTNTDSQDKDRFVIAANGNIGVNGADTSLFNLQVSGDIGPNFTNLYNLGSFTSQWNAVYGKKLYQDGNEVCDTTNNCSNSSRWSSLSSPTTSLNLDMGAYATNLTYGNSTGTSDLFTLSDSRYNKGTGSLMTLATAPGSVLNPFHITAGAGEVMTVNHDGKIGLGTAAPTARLHVKETGQNNHSNYSGYIENLAENGSTDGINKYGLYLTSTGNFSGGVGSATNNYGIYINTTTGADNNYDIYAASGAYLSTGGTWTNASSRSLKENFQSVDTTDILRKIDQLDLSSWNYKNENVSVRHLGPIAEDFYNIFHLGNSNKSISTIDPAGVALAGVKALNTKIEKITRDSNYLSLNSEGDVSITTSGNIDQNGRSLQEIKSDVNNTRSNVILTNGNILENILAFGQVITSKLKAGLIVTQNALIENTLYARKITGENIKVLTAKIDFLTINTLNANQKITSPIIETTRLVATQEADLTKIKTNHIAALTDNVNFDLNTSNTSGGSQPENQGELAKIIINGLDDKAVTTFDAAGNITTQGNITSGTATVSGSLTANNIQTSNLQSDTVSANTASFSGELVADNIKSKTIDQLSDKITNSNSSISSITNQVNDVQKLINEIKNRPLGETIITPPVSLPPSVQGQNILAYNSSVETFNITNHAYIYKASIADSLVIGSLIAKDTSILSLNSDLNISSLGTINFFENAVTIAKDGTLTTKGVINALAGIKTNTIRPISDSDNVNVVLGNDTASSQTSSSFDIQNKNNENVASIDSSGKGKFRELSLNKYLSATESGAVIAAADNLTRNGQYSPAIETTNEAAGEGVVPTRNSEVIIYNDSVKDSSLIYLTPTSVSQGANLTVVKKEACVNGGQPCRHYFKVGVESAVSSPLTFNWLIIN